MGSNCGHHHDVASPTADAVRGAMRDAEDRFVETGERLTAPRRRVLELLIEGGGPLKAYDLIARFGEDGTPAKPPTVYRALEALERQGLVHRIASISAYVACTQGGQAHAAAFLICDCCGDTREIAPPPGADLAREAGVEGYVLSRVTIEGRGRCAACAEPAA